jgi:magnesium-transporting ATPase (P-type)
MPLPPTTIPYQPPDTLLIISGIAVICVALLFVERYALRRQMRATVPWPQRIANLLRGVGIWWLVLGGSTFLIFLVVYIVMHYQENANGDLSILLVNIFSVTAGLALVTIGVTLILLLTGVGMLFYFKSRGSKYVEG